jgi:predicted O-methyltransferase YrrM
MPKAARTMASAVATDQLSVEHVLALYTRFRDDLRRARERLRLVYRTRCVPWRERSLLHRLAARAVQPFAGPVGRQPRMLAQSDDEVCEILYLLVREQCPETVVEISPFHGWSTCWLLTALRDNGRGRLQSFDLIDASRRNVPADLAARWELVVGDVRGNVQRLPPAIDFLLMDSDHSAAFAHWYLDHVVARVRDQGVVAVDDVFHRADPGAFDGEGRVVVDWLASRELPFFTCAKAKNPSVLNALHGHKVALGLAERIHRSDANTTIFFRQRR